MEQLADNLGSRLQAPVEDRTGLKERYDGFLDMPAPVDLQDRDPQRETMDAVKKLGLTLKPSKILVEMLIVDNAAKTPAPN